MDGVTADATADQSADVTPVTPPPPLLDALALLRLESAVYRGSDASPPPSGRSGADQTLGGWRSGLVRGRRQARVPPAFGPALGVELLGEHVGLRLQARRPRWSAGPTGPTLQMTPLLYGVGGVDGERSYDQIAPPS